MPVADAPVGVARSSMDAASTNPPRTSAAPAGDEPFAPHAEGRQPDERLADAIDHDILDRLVRGLPVELERYLPAIDPPERCPLSIDAAVDGALRGLVAQGRPFREAVEELGRRHTQLKQVIDSTATITMLFGPSGGAGHEGGPLREHRLPSRFGRILPDGGGRYELLQALGARRPARVFRAHDLLLGRPEAPSQVVVKILGRAGDQAQLDEAIEEARLLRSVRHEVTVGLVDSGVSDDDEVYVVTEFVEAPSLREWVEREGTPDRTTAVRLVASLAAAVGQAHREGVVHCDLSPGNILVDERQRPRLVDFGSASRIDQPAGEMRVVRGTPGFMAPEQTELSRPPRPALDVYALGAILFWLLTGASANGRDSEQIDAVLAGRQDPRPWRREMLAAAAVPRGLATLVLDATAMDPAARPADGAALAAALQAWLEESRRRALPAWRRGMEWMRRRQVLTLFAVVLVTVSGTLLAVTLALRPGGAPRGGVEQSLLAGRSNAAVGYGMRRWDRSLRVERDEARSLLARVPQVLGAAPVPADQLMDWARSRDAERLAELLRGLQVIAGRHGESQQMEALVLRVALGMTLLAQDRDPGNVMRTARLDWDEAFSPGDPLRSLGGGLQAAATARELSQGLRSGRLRPGLPAEEMVLVRLDAAIRENRAADRDLAVQLFSRERDRLAAVMAERPSLPAASGEPPGAAAAPPPG